jgi:hypothetical protein
MSLNKKTLTRKEYHDYSGLSCVLWGSWKKQKMIFVVSCLLDICSESFHLCFLSLERQTQSRPNFVITVLIVAMCFHRWVSWWVQVLFCFRNWLAGLKIPFESMSFGRVYLQPLFVESHWLTSRHRSSEEIIEHKNKLIAWFTITKGQNLCRRLMTIVCVHFLMSHVSWTRLLSLLKRQEFFSRSRETVIVYFTSLTKEKSEK